MVYRTIVGHSNDDGSVAILSSRNAVDLGLAEELAESWFNRLIGFESDTVGIVDYVGLQRWEDESGEWVTMSEFEG
jgi:hypothetical protein